LEQRQKMITVHSESWTCW